MKLFFPLIPVHEHIVKHAWCVNNENAMDCLLMMGANVCNRSLVF